MLSQFEVKKISLPLKNNILINSHAFGNRYCLRCRHDPVRANYSFMNFFGVKNFFSHIFISSIAVRKNLG